MNLECIARGREWECRGLASLGLLQHTPGDEAAAIYESESNNKYIITLPRIGVSFHVGYIIIVFVNMENYDHHRRMMMIIIIRHITMMNDL